MNARMAVALFLASVVQASVSLHLAPAAEPVVPQSVVRDAVSRRNQQRQNARMQFFRVRDEATGKFRTYTLMVPFYEFYPDYGMAFDVSKAMIPYDHILPGTLNMDAIPPLGGERYHAPKFVPAAEAAFLKDDDRVIGVANGKSAKAYPVNVMNWHEIVNDTVGDRPVTVTWCPLSGAAVCFDRRVDGELATFGVSGKLYNNTLLMWDHESESLWSQLTYGAVAGKASGRKLDVIPSVLTSWKKWREEHPQTLVLSRETGHDRDYTADPYAFTPEQQDRIPFPPEKVEDDRAALLHFRDYVLGIRAGGEARAYPFNRLKEAEVPFEDTVGGVKLTIHYYAESNTATARDADGRLYTGAVSAFWLMWYAFNPNTSIYGE